MQKCHRLWLLWVCALLFNGIVLGQFAFQSLAFETINEKRGLSHHAIRSILQDSRGFIWIGTEYGLNRYEGVACTPFWAAPGQPNSLPDNQINQMAEDRAGNLWIGTANGVARLNQNTGKMAHYLNSGGAPLNLKNFNFNTFADREGNIWAANDFYLLKYNPANDGFKGFMVDCGQSTGFTRNFYILDLLQDSKGRIWVGTSYGVKLFNPQSEKFISYHFPEKDGRLVQNAITSLAEAPDGRVFAGTWGGGMLVFDDTLKRFVPVNLPGYPFSPGFGQMVMDIVFLKGTIMLGTVSGLATAKFPECLNGAGWSVYRPNPGDIHSLPGQVVSQILHDRQGNIWVGTNNNLARTDPRMAQFRHLPFKNKEGIPLQPTSAEANDPGRGPASWWMGATGLYLAVSGQAQMQEQGVARLIASADNDGVIWDMHRGKKFLWLATTNGLIAFEREKRKVVHHYRHLPGNPASLPGNRLWKVYEDRKGNVWVGTIRMGVGLLDPATGRFRNFFLKKGERASLYNVTPSGFFEDSVGDIWFGGDDWLYHYIARADSFRIIPFVVKNNEGKTLKGLPRPFLEGKNGQIWIAFSDGLAQINKKTNAIAPLLLHEPYFRPTGEMVVRNRRQVWFGTSAGLFRLDTVGMRLTRFTSLDGLLSNETDGCLARLCDGSMVSGFTGTITHFSPDGLELENTPPALAFARVQVNGRDTVTGVAGRLILPYQSTIQFDFAALSYGNAGQNSYRYKLEGTEKEWGPVTERRSVTYAQLQPGRFTFLVKGCNSDGVWNEQPLAFAFEVKAPFYLQWWFWAVAFLLAVAAVFLIYRNRFRQALKMERLRTRLATDLHDDVGATLSAISMYADALKKQVSQPQVSGLLGKIGEECRQTVRTMSDIVWAINPRNDSGMQLVQRMENLATDLCASAGIALVFTQKNAHVGHFPGIEVRRNIYLIFKEALNNALKYANCSTIRIEVEQKRNGFSLALCDDGTGFDPGAVLQGNGLGNMKERAKEVGGTLTIQAATGKGCTVQLWCPV